MEPSALGFHEPTYFLVGGKDPVSARFQFSFRYRIFDDQGVVAERHRPAGRGATQQVEKSSDLLVGLNRCARNAGDVHVACRKRWTGATCIIS